MPPKEDSHETPWKCPSTPSEFRRKYPSATNLDELKLGGQDSTMRVSGSKWGEEHLKACRVLLVPPARGNHLAILGPKLKTVNLESAPDFENALGLSVASSDSSSPAVLRRDGGPLGAFFVRLRELKTMPDSEDDEDEVAAGPSISTPQIRRSNRPAAPLTPSKTKDFTSGDGLGLSSPLEPSSSQATNSSDGYSPKRLRQPYESENRIIEKHETVTAGMAAEFISCTLDICGPHHQKSSNAAEYRTAPTMREIKRLPLDCTAQDDGSIIWQPETGAQKTLAIVEAKKSRYRGLGKPHPPVRVVAQQVSEMLSLCLHHFPETQWMDNFGVGKLLTHIFLISVHQCDMTFLCWEVTKEYLTYLYPRTIEPDSDSDSNDRQQKSSLPFMEIHQSNVFDLSTPDGRRDAARAITALVLFMEEKAL